MCTHTYSGRTGCTEFVQGVQLAYDVYHKRTRRTVRDMVCRVFRTKWIHAVHHAHIKSSDQMNMWIKWLWTKWTGPLLYTSLHSGTLWYILVHSGTLWYKLGTWSPPPIWTSMQNLESVAQKIAELWVLMYLITFVICSEYPYELPCKIWSL